MTDATLTDATLADSDVAVMLCGHGSRDPEASRQFEAAVALARDKAGGRPRRARIPRIRASDSSPRDSMP